MESSSSRWSRWGVSTLTSHLPTLTFTTSPRGWMVAEPGVRFGIAHGLLVAALLVAGGLGLGVALTFTLTVVTAVVAGLGLGPAWRAGIGVSAWALFTGFAENRFGLLTFTDPDLVRLAVLLVSTTAVSWLVLRRLPRSQERERA